MNEVYIDGVRYVPATEASVDAKGIAKGLVSLYWGPEVSDRVLEENRNLVVIVSDSVPPEDGDSIQDAVAAILQQIGDFKETSDE